MDVDDHSARSQDLTAILASFLTDHGLELLLEHLPLALWVTDRELRIGEVRGTLVEHLALERKPLFEVFQTDDPGVTPIAETLEALAGEAVQFEMTRNGVHLLCAVHPIVNRGCVIGTVAFAMDDSSQRVLSERLLSAEQRYRDIFDRSTDLIFTMDLEGRVLSVNRAALSLTGYTREEFVRLTFYEIVAPDLRTDAFKMMREQLGGATNLDLPIRLARKDGTEASFLLHTRLLFDAGIPSIIQVTARRPTDEDVGQPTSD